MTTVNLKGRTIKEIEKVTEVAMRLRKHLGANPIKCPTAAQNISLLAGLRNTRGSFGYLSFLTSCKKYRDVLGSHQYLKPEIIGGSHENRKLIG